MRPNVTNVAWFVGASVCVCRCVSQCVTVSVVQECEPYKMAEPIEMQFGVVDSRAEMDMGWVHPWVGLDRIFQHM